MPHIQRLAIGSILVGIVVVVLKYLAYVLTGSIALYSDAFESVVNIITSIAALIAVRMSGRQADQDHPYGYDKAEYFSAVFCGVLVVVAAIVILHDAYLAFLQPKEIHPPWQGLALNGVAGLVNAAWSAVLIRMGRRHRSPALVADGRHLLADVVTSAGVLLGVVLVTLTGWALLDPALAAMVAMHILWSGWQTIKEGTGGLMDQAVPADTLAEIRQLIMSNAAEAIEVHDLRTRHAGRKIFVEFHLVVQGTLTVIEAHRICDRIEAALKRRSEEMLITIHVEPDDKVKHANVLMI